jgi:uncharacterized repeat protein (TIGR01451 family)
MAGRLGLAAKIFFGTTVLAGGGSGAWYATTHGWPSPTGGATEVVAANGETEAAADLEAVASAWKEPLATEARAAINEDSSPVARSANVEPISEPASKAAATGDRYATASAPDTPEVAEVADVAEAAEATQADAADTTTDAKSEAEPEVAETAAPMDISAAETEPAEEDVQSSPTDAVARGQAPSDTPSSANAVPISDEFSEPQPIRPLSKEGSRTSTDERAREAFRDNAVTAAGDRYGSSVVGSATAGDIGNKQAVNPFAAKSQTSGQASGGLEQIEPLAGSNNAAGQLPALQQDPPEPRPLQPNRMTRAANATDVDHFRGSEQASDASTPTGSSLGGGMSTKGGIAPSEPAGLGAELDGTGKPGERALEGPQRPALEIQKYAPAEIQVGKPAKFVVQVRNVGTQGAENVIIRDEIPQGTRLVSTTPTAETDGTHIVWNFDKLSPGEDRTVEMQVMPTAEGELGSVATVSYSAQASVKAKCTMPQLAIRMTAPAKVMIGEQTRVKIELRNPGSGDATGVMLFENVPPTVKHAAGPALEFEIGTLRAGETRELELVLTADKAGKTVNVLSARAEGNLQVQQQVEFEVVAPELSIDVNGPERRYLERPATYEVCVENPGTAPAHDVQIVTKLPKGLKFLRANNMGEYDAASHAVYWSLAELPEGEKGTVELVAMPVEAGPQTLAVESRAGQGLADATQRQIMIDGLAAIMFEVRDLEDPIEVGRETGYEIRVVNQGTKAATNVQVAVKLPAGMQLVSAEGETQHAEQQGAVIFEPLAQLAAKADTVYRVRVQGTAAGDQRVTVEVNTDDLAQPIRREESTLVFGDE